MLRILIRLLLIAVLSLIAACRRGAWPLASGQTVAGRRAFAEGLVRSERAVLDDSSGATHYQIDVRIGSDLALQGHQQVRYTNREDVALEDIYFRLLPNGAGGQLSVSNVTVDGQAVQAAPGAPGTENLALRVPLPAPLAPGQQVAIALDFALVVPREAGGNYGLLGYLQDTLVLDAFYPMIPAYDQAGWNAAPPPPNADASYNDASYYLVRVTAPSALVLVASGVEVERQRVGDEQVVTFAAGPARDFYLAGSELFQVRLSETVGQVRVNSYALPGQEDAARRALRAASEAIEIFGQFVGPYPYTEFDIVNAPLVGALGIEYPGVVGISRPLYDGRGSDTQLALESTVAHEVAHQWFYNVVGNDQPGQPWLDEAMAQYLTMVYYREAYGDAQAAGVRASWQGRWERVSNQEIPIGLPAGQYSGREYGAIVYGRGPLFLEALATQMGQPWETFVRDYYRSYKWGIATTEGFKGLAELHCQCDLTPLFAQWVYDRS